MPVTATFRFQRQTERAVCVLTPEGEPVWLPKSQISYDDDLDGVDRNTSITFTLTDWIARQKGIAASPEDVNEDKFTVVEYTAADGSTKYKIEVDGVVICRCDDQGQAQMIAAAMALTEGKV